MRKTQLNVWIAMLFVSGLALKGAALIAILGAAGLYAAYLYFPHVAFRVDGPLPAPGHEGESAHLGA